MPWRGCDWRGVAPKVLEVPREVRLMVVGRMAVAKAWRSQER